MTESIIESIIEALNGTMGREAIIFIISMIPILELRGALLVAGPLLGIPVTTALPICIIGNLIPVPFILLFNISTNFRKISAVASASSTAR